MEKLGKHIGKPFLIGGSFMLGMIIVYAASSLINSVTIQTINQGDEIGSGWFQEVNDWIVNSGATKEYVDGGENISQISDALGLDGSVWPTYLICDDSNYDRKLVWQIDSYRWGSDDVRYENLSFDDYLIYKQSTRDFDRSSKSTIILNCDKNIDNISDSRKIF